MTNLGKREIVNTLKSTNLINVKYDYDGTCELEFYKDGKEIFVRNVKARNHVDFNNNEVIQEILKAADNNDINIEKEIIMKNLKVELSRENLIVNGFNVKEGYVSFINSNNEVIGISSGWTDNDLMYIYTHKNGEWIGNWEDDLDFPVEEAIEKIQEWQKEKEMMELKLEVEKLINDGVALYKSDEPIRFVDVAAGNKSSDGGEYGFYTTYYPTEVIGIYEYHTSTTCEFDTCGTGYEGLEILTQKKYQYLLNNAEVE